MLLKVENLNHCYYKYKLLKKFPVQILKNINFSVYHNEMVGLIGLSGSGKSTIAKIVAQLIKPNMPQSLLRSHLQEAHTNKTLHNLEPIIESNQHKQAQYPDSKESSFVKNSMQHKILFNNQEIKLKSQHDKREFYKQVQILFQDSISSLNPRLTILENLQEPLQNLLQITHKETQLQKIRLLFDELKLPHRILYQYPSMISGGQAQRICIARCLLIAPSFIILDETTSNLDYLMQQEIMQIFTTMKHEKKCTFLFITHNINLAKQFCDRILLMQNGSIIEEAHLDKDQRGKKLFQSDLGQELESCCNTEV
ncbi:ABC transporter ATP-binding protein [Helicobacter didelphidarum]|uniref:ABC transporter ATP-binding protein n=1 Tax=Helicobacter didelphidarum TaxID=2040648 RepID=A0A3D8IP66_9HELI|nr:dipeptide/oligopeptide/nickel ABC transporter ATP-binding protein [Helicobacter didelphidarum]RDU66391.1 ABC transporter ATP-binding protein [Helicobacter didelphidarum]